MRALLLALLGLAVPGAAWPVDAGLPSGRLSPVPPEQVGAVPVSLLADMGSGQVLHAHNADLHFAPASMTKVMTAYLAFELIARGKLLPEQHLIVSPETAAEWNGKGTSMYLRAGESVSVDMLLHGLATASANDAAIVLAEGFAGDVPSWTGLMNAEARRLGMNDSHFNTPNGWPDNGKTYVTATDLVKLSKALITRHPALYHRYFGRKRFEWHGAVLQSHDPTVGIVRGADGIKTGYTREAGYNFLGSAERRGRRLVMVIGGAESGAQRAKASRELLEWGYSAWKARPLFAARAPIGEARVQGGQAGAVPLVADSPVYAAIPQAGGEAISLRIVYDGPLVAPIAVGAEVGQLEIRVGDGEAGHVPLYAGRAVREAGPLDRLRNGLMNLIP
ncbi:MAG: D-alanyl-D-alanine carboxypeptidase family protein [Novosphingobium sp.]